MDSTRPNCQEAIAFNVPQMLLAALISMYPISGSEIISNDLSLPESKAICVISGINSDID